MFLKHGGNRITTSGTLPNVRMVLEAAMVGGMVGSTQALPSLLEKQAFLQALHPRERLRLLTMVCPFLKALVYTSKPLSMQFFCTVARERVTGARRY